MEAKLDTQATIDALEAAIDALKAAKDDLPDATRPAPQRAQLRSPHPKRLRGMAMIGIFMLILEAFIMIVLTAASFLGGEPFELSAVGGETFLVLPRSSMSMIALLSLLLAVVISVAIERTIVKPMRNMTWHMGELAKGDFSIRMPPNERIEINEAKQFTKSFNKAAEELSGIEIMRANFISDFSHEFRTPIASISGFAQLLRDQDLSEEEREEYLDIIIDESKRLSSLSEDILNLSRMESSSILTNVGTVDVAEGLRRSIAIVEPNANEKNIAISVDINEAELVGNADYLSQLWTNIMQNAVKFTPENGHIDVSLKTAQDAKNRTVTCTISDNGCGMDGTTRAHLFERFYQGDTSHAQEGNGLGLALCKRIVDLHGGTIRVKSTLGKGSTFIVTLPCD